TVGGETVLMKSGGDMQVVTTNVLADKDILLASGGNMTIASAANTQSMHEYSQVDKKGLFTTSPTSATLGKQRTQNQADAMQTTYTGSLIGTTGGNVSLVSNGSLAITNSDVIAKKDGTNTNTGNIYIQATDATIQSQNTISNNSHRFAQKTTGVTASVSSSLVSEVQSLETLKESVNDTDSRKAKLASTLAAASKVKTLINNLNNKDLGSLRAQATIGSQSTKNQTTSHQETNDAANLLAQNNLIVNLKGKGADSDLTVIGSNLTVGNNFYQSVEGDVIYQASTQTNTTNSQNSSKGWGAGVYASTQMGGGQSNRGFTINANKAKGSSNDTTTTHTNTQVTVGGTTINDIGGSLILDGANLDTKHLTGTVGGDLIVKSRQDTYQYTHDQKQAGFSADVDFNGKPQSISINGGKTDADADYAQVTHQSGIKAKESTLIVQGQGNFTGGYLITDAGKNQTQFAQGIQTQDIHNHLDYEGDAISVGIGIGADTSNPNGKAKPALQGLGYGKIDPTHKTSTTHSAITDQAGLSHINTESFKQEEVQHELNQIITNDFNKEQVLKELNAQVNITTEFGKEAPKRIGDYAQNKELELLAQGNIEEAQKWSEGGVYRVALHTAVGALGTGTIEGTLATASVATAAPKIEKLEAILTEKLANDDSLESKQRAEQAAKAIIGVALLTVGETSGLNTSSTMMAANVEVNNRWLHDNEIIKIFGKKAQLEQFAKEQGITYEEAWRAVLAQAYRDTDDNFRKTHQSSAESKLSKAAQDFLRKNDLYIKSTAQERVNSQQNTKTTKYKGLLNSVINNTPKQTQKQVNQTVLTQTAKTSAAGAAKGVGNIPSDTANGIANIFHREVKPTFPYSNEEEANVGAVAQNVVGVGTMLVGGTKFGSKPSSKSYFQRTFQSSDPHVADVANAIERAHPGLVKDVNVPMRRADNSLITDADILLNNGIIIQVKSGGGKGLTSQISRTETGTGLKTIGYGPDLKPSIIQNSNGKATKSLEELIKMVGSK
ncbi:hemagglutinin repeat-containing protein, partial [Moraxella sp.]|uniref:hemagglutinin repeat-containing protein n=1 Tax=Moraxella sp. TaxID=479 RepID=UPI0026DBED29